MLERIIKGDASGILCWKLDRLARNPIDGGQINWLLQQGTIQIIKTNERDYYPSDNVLMMQVELGMANQYIRDLSSNVKRGLAKKLRDGWLPGLAPIGYLNDKTNEKGNRTVMNDPDRFVLVRRIWDQALTGNYTVPQLWEYSRKELNLTTVPRRKSGGKPLSKSAMYSLLTNPFYYGMIRYLEKTGELHQGKHEPMITVQEFVRVQDIIGTRNAIRPKNEVFAFTGLMKCGNCGCSVTAESKIKRCKNGNSHYYTYYHCTKKKVDIKCDQKSVEVRKLETMFKEKLMNLQISDAFKAWAIKHLHEIRTTEADSNKIAMSVASKELATVSEQLRSLTLNYTSPENINRSVMNESEYLEIKNGLLKKMMNEAIRFSRLSLAERANAAPTMLSPVRIDPISWLNAAFSTISTLRITITAFRKSRMKAISCSSLFSAVCRAFCSRMNAMKLTRLSNTQVNVKMRMQIPVFCMSDSSVCP